MNSVAVPVTEDDSPERLQRLEALAERLLDACRAQGASQAEVSCSEERGLSVGVRMGEVETVESTRDRGIGVTVYFGQRQHIQRLAALLAAAGRQEVAGLFVLSSHRIRISH